MQNVVTAVHTAAEAAAQAKQLFAQFVKELRDLDVRRRALLNRAAKRIDSEEAARILAQITNG